jgi:predicted small lipoprotein YifL
MRKVFGGLLAVVAVATLAGCGRETTPQLDDAAGVTTTSTTVAGGGRLHTSYVSSPYEERGNCQCYFRVDAPSDAVVATHTPQEVIDATRSERSDKYAATAWFGVFAGNVPNPNAPDGRLTGVHWVTDVPVWLIITHDTERVTYGKGGPPVPGKTTYDVAVFADADLSKPFNGFTSTTGDGDEPALS